MTLPQTIAAQRLSQLRQTVTTVAVSVQSAQKTQELPEPSPFRAPPAAIATENLSQELARSHLVLKTTYPHKTPRSCPSSLPALKMTSQNTKSVPSSRNSVRYARSSVRIEHIVPTSI